MGGFMAPRAVGPGGGLEGRGSVVRCNDAVKRTVALANTFFKQLPTSQELRLPQLLLSLFYYSQSL